MASGIASISKGKDGCEAFEVYDYEVGDISVVYIASVGMHFLFTNITIVYKSDQRCKLSRNDQGHLPWIIGFIDSGPRTLL